MTDTRVSSVVVEVASTADSDSQVSQQSLDVLQDTSSDSTAEFGYMSIDVLMESPLVSSIELGSLVIETLVSVDPPPPPVIPPPDPGDPSPLLTSKLYPALDTRGWIRQPNFIRRRHRYRGVRESFKINQEIYQYYYDLRNIDYKIDVIKEVLDERVDFFLEENNHVDCLADWGDDATPTLLEIFMFSLEEMKTQIASLRERIKDLEP